MTLDEFELLVKGFAKNPIVSTTVRHVYLWHDREESIYGLIPTSVRDSLNLHRLVDAIASSPYDQVEAARILQKALRDWLKQNLTEKRQHIVVVTGCDLLSRYSVPVTSLFQWASDTVMFIFVVQNTRFLQLAGDIPSYMTFDPQSTFTYLQEIVGETALIEAER